MRLLPMEREEGDARQVTKHILRYSLLTEKHGEQRNRDKGTNNREKTSTERGMGQT